MLVLTRKIGQSITVGDPASAGSPVEITLLDVDYYQAAAVFSVSLPFCVTGQTETVLYPPDLRTPGVRPKNSQAETFRAKSAP